VICNESINDAIMSIKAAICGQERE